MIKAKGCARGEKGQVALVFIASMVIIIAAMALLIDGGRYLVMRNQARMMADAAAISGAGILNVREAGSGNFILDDIAAELAASNNFELNDVDSPEYADFSLDDVNVQGNRIWVTVTGRSTPLFGAQWGLNYSATIVSSARAGTGITSEN
jgi:uncharacterized membrane protein